MAAREKEGKRESDLVFFPLFTLAAANLLFSSTSFIRREHIFFFTVGNAKKALTGEKKERETSWVLYLILKTDTLSWATFRDHKFRKKKVPTMPTNVTSGYLRALFCSTK